MRVLFLLLLSLPAFSQTDCTSSNINVYDSKGILVSSHTQSYKAEVAAILIAQQQGKSTVKTPDIVCTSKVKTYPIAATLVWETPTTRSNGQPMANTEIGGYEIRQMVNGSQQIIKATKDETRKSIQYYGDGVQIATYDTKMKYSQFITVK